MDEHNENSTIEKDSIEKNEQKEKMTKARELLSRLKEIEAQESELKLERKEIISKEPWYKKPGHLIGIAAILTTVLVTFFSNYENIELTIIQSKPSPLVTTTPQVGSKIDIYYDKQSIGNLGQLTISIQNTGTKAISQTHFSDGPLSFKLISSKTSSSIPLLLDVIVKKNSNQQNDQLKILSKNNPSEISYLPSLLNKGDSVELELYTSQIDGLNVEAKGKMVDGIIKYSQVESTGTIDMLPLDIMHFLKLKMGGKWKVVTLFGFILLLFSIFVIVLYFEVIIVVTGGDEKIVLILSTLFLIGFIGLFVLSIVS